MTEVLMIIENRAKKMITTNRPFVGNSILDNGYYYTVKRIILRSGSSIMEAIVDPPGNLDDYDLFHLYGWKAL